MSGADTGRGAPARGDGDGEQDWTAEPVEQMSSSTWAIVIAGDHSFLRIARQILPSGPTFGW